MTESKADNICSICVKSHIINGRKIYNIIYILPIYMHIYYKGGGTEIIYIMYKGGGRKIYNIYIYLIYLILYI